MKFSSRILLTFSLTLFGVAQVAAYDADTHYAFTYFAARATGFTPMQAYRIASACVEVDSPSNPDTEPEQGQRLLGPDDRAHDIRVRFHAFSDQRRFPFAMPYAFSPTWKSGLQTPALNGRFYPTNTTLLTQYRASREAIGQVGMQLSARCKVLRNPGIYLHFLQDSFSHDAYGSSWGHWTPASYGNPANRVLAFGTTTDYVSYEPVDALGPNHLFVSLLGVQPQRNERMATETVAALSRFMDGTKQNPKFGATATTKLMLTRLQAVNRIPGVQLGDLVGTHGPDLLVALDAVDAMLKTALHDTVGIPNIPLTYQFVAANKPGDFISAGPDLLDRMTLYGKLKVVPPSLLREQGGQVTVRLRDDYEAGKGPIIFRGRLSNPTIVEGCPVGTVEVDLDLTNGVQLRTTTTVNALANECNFAPTALNVESKNGVNTLRISMGSIGANSPDSLVELNAILQKKFRHFGKPASGQSPSLEWAKSRMKEMSALQQSALAEYDAGSKKRQGELLAATTVMVGQRKLVLKRVGITSQFWLDLARPMLAQMPKWMSGTTPAERQTRMDEVMAAVPDTVIECELPAIDDSQLIGEIVVTHKDRKFPVGYIGNYEIPIHYTASLSSTGLNGAFMPNSVHLLADVAAIVKMLFVRPRSLSNPPAAGVLVSTDHWVLPNVLSCTINAGGLAVSGVTLESQTSRTMWSLGKREDDLRWNFTWVEKKPITDEIPSYLALPSSFGEVIKKRFAIGGRPTESTGPFEIDTSWFDAGYHAFGINFDAGLNVIPASYQIAARDPRFKSNEPYPYPKASDQSRRNGYSLSINGGRNPYVPF